MDKETAFRTAELGLSAAPEVGILGLFAFVQYSNFKSGSTTTDAGTNPLFPQPTSPSITAGLAAVSQGDLQAISTALGTIEGVLLTPGVGTVAAEHLITDLAVKTAQPVAAVVTFLKNLLGI